MENAKKDSIMDIEMPQSLEAPKCTSTNIHVKNDKVEEEMTIEKSPKNIDDFQLDKKMLINKVEEISKKPIDTKNVEVGNVEEAIVVGSHSSLSFVCLNTPIEATEQSEEMIKFDDCQVIDNKKEIMPIIHQQAHDVLDMVKGNIVEQKNP